MKKIVSFVVAAVLSISLVMCFAEAPEFSDVPLEHWAYSEISELTANGIVNGMGDGTFAPDSPVTREQFIKLLVLSAGFDVFDMEYFTSSDINNPQIFAFADVGEFVREHSGILDWSGDWSAPYVYTAVMNGIVKYIDYTPIHIETDYTAKDVFYFNPQQPLNRDETARYISRALEFINGAQLNFADSTSIEYKDDVAKNVQAGILKGFEDNTFRPQNFTTRAEMAVIMFRVLNHAKSNPIHKKTFEKVIAHITNVGNNMIYANEITPYLMSKSEWDNYQDGDKITVNNDEYFVVEHYAADDYFEGFKVLFNRDGGFAMEVRPHDESNYALYAAVGGSSRIYRETGKNFEYEMSNDFYYFDYDGQGGANWFEYSDKAAFIDKCAVFEEYGYPSVTLQIVNGKVMFAYTIG